MKLTFDVNVVLVRSILEFFGYTVVEGLDGPISSLLRVKLDEAEALHYGLTLISVHCCSIIGINTLRCLKLRQRDITNLASSLEDLSDILQSKALREILHINSACVYFGAIYASRIKR